MLDVQRERLRHLVANAILELWKKETGSLSPVVIEGTVCITAGNGRTTVVQVSNQFSGSMPDSIDDGGPTYNTPKRRMLSQRNPYNFAPHIDIAHAHNAAMMAAYFEELSPASLISPNTQPSVMIARDSRPSLRVPPAFMYNSHARNYSTSDQSMDISNIKDELLSDEDNEDEDEDESGADTTANSSNTGPVIPGTGFYIEEDGEDDKPADSSRNDEPQSKDNSVNEDNKRDTSKASTPSPKGPLMSTPKSTSQVNNGLKDTSEESNALDLSSGRKEDDLALSPPQNYTAQVRNVIRQRLLASRQNSADAKGDTAQQGNNHTDENGDDDSQSPPASDTLPSPLPPLMNLNLNSPSMLSNYHSMMSQRSPMAPSPGSLQDILRMSRQESPVFPPDMFSPGRSLSSPYDQNGNDKETMYVNDKGEPQKVYRCNYCSKTFLFKSKYYEHLPVHTNVRPFQCHLCSRTYKYKYDLRVHLRTHMGIPTKSTVCPFCAVKFDTNKMLRLHIQEFHHSSVSNVSQPSPGSAESSVQSAEPLSPAV